MSKYEDAATLVDQVEGEPEPGASRLPLPERYEDRGVIGRGGHGEVRRAWDRMMQRDVAVKVLGWQSLSGDTSGTKRFSHEASITARLAHPGVVPVHERGTLSDGRPFFVMKEVKGRTLGQVISAVHQASSGRWGELGGWTLRRMIGALARVAETVGFAHGQGIVHRDLKPPNIMVGSFGEVFVMDWGIARVIDGDEWDPLTEDEATEVGPSPGGTLRTSTGDVVGTVAYMSPEQAQAKPSLIDARPDVYALGLILGEMLTGIAVNGGRPHHQLFGDILRGVTPELRIGSGGPPIPEELGSVFSRAVRLNPSERFVDGTHFGLALRRWLDGDARRAKASELVDSTSSLRATLDSLRSQEASLRAEARATLAELPPAAPEALKLPGWRAEDAADALQARLERLEGTLFDALRGALQHEPEHPEAHHKLAELYRERVVEAEMRRDDRQAARALVGLRRHDRGRFRSFIEGNGTVSLETVPRGAVASISRVVEVDRRDVLQPFMQLGPTPSEAELPAGSYVMEVRMEGYHPVTYPVRIDRDGHWDSAPSPFGDRGPLVLPLLGDLAIDDVFVAGGWSPLGGDDEAPEGLPGVTPWIPSFVMKRFACTNEEYIEFLDELVAAGQGAEAAERLPRRVIAGRDEPLFELVGSRHRICAGPALGESSLRSPVTSVSLEDAWAYASWRSARDGVRWRLPMEAEWEKAARGVDRRPYVWGRRFELTWANVAGSRPHPSVEAVDVTRRDISPYGVVGLSGNLREWCADPYRDSGSVGDGQSLEPMFGWAGDNAGLYCVRGSTFFTRSAPARVCARFAATPGERIVNVGFRLVRSYPP
ncbi:MAG: bifunctional serine/threonine-protein kinase/formylglycine-generating enzyme family protein [Myxococcota bacterium]